MATMEKPANHLQKICSTNAVQFQALKCPRCDSSNTKFCYYNNYSLTQPRHFCKACKRYWTRGGTLRNVPVGGSCRKNKRIRRPSSSNTNNSTSSSSSSLLHDLSLHNSSNPTINLPSTTPHMENPFLGYTLPSNSTTSDLVNNLLYPNPTRFRPDLGLGFSPMGNNHLDHSLLSSYINRPMFSSSTPQFDQQIKPFASPVSDHVNGMNTFMKTDQEEGQNRSEWNYQLAQIMESSDSSLYNWNIASSSMAGSSWLDPQNIIGSSSVPSLI